MRRLEIPSELIPQLFTIETNLQFELEAVALDENLQAIGKAFGLDAERAWHLNKPSPTSRLYRLDGTRALMVRGICATGSETMAAQCHVARELNYGGFIYPLITAEGPVIIRNGTAWMAYEAQPGEVYDGANCPLSALFEGILSLQNALALAPPDKNLPKVTHRPDDWSAFYKTNLNLPKNLGEAARILVNRNKDALSGLAEDVSNLVRNGKTRLVHNDLNHANVLVHKERPFFLDLEDIVYEIPEVSMAHALFKLVRHRVYRKTITLDKARAEIPVLLGRLEKDGYNLPDRAALFRYGALRILSEIHMICMWVFEKGDYSLIYDLEKKIHNLFELWLLTETNHEFSS
ncbi:MAG: hypothetical protein A2516_08775 [Alphaproteobacteria bacterium RIFOXYD12_FULL_60_8]|nr:MAG: hypothetical protein A2516_08775 [Alphaproteobacteria bacterium RIFOXYD12_FULL_60_8]